MFFFVVFIYFFVQKGSDVLPAELLEKAEMPKVVFIGFGLAALLCLLLGNAALFAWFIIRKRSKGLQFYFNWLLSFDFIIWFLGSHICLLLNTGIFQMVNAYTYGSNTLYVNLSVEICSCITFSSWLFFFSFIFLYAFTLARRWVCSVRYLVWHISTNTLYFMRYFYFLWQQIFEHSLCHATQTFLINFGLLRCTIVWFNVSTKLHGFSSVSLYRSPFSFVVLWTYYKS